MCSRCSACSKSRGQSNLEEVPIHAPETLAPSVADLDHHPCAHHDQQLLLLDLPQLEERELVFSHKTLAY
jgi:hypothetical protein